MGDQSLPVRSRDMPLHQYLADQQVIGARPQHYQLHIRVIRHCTRDAVDAKAIQDLCIDYHRYHAFWIYLFD